MSIGSSEENLKIYLRGHHNTLLVTAENSWSHTSNRDPSIFHFELMIFFTEQVKRNTSGSTLQCNEGHNEMCTYTRTCPSGTSFRVMDFIVYDTNDLLLYAAVFAALNDNVFPPIHSRAHIERTNNLLKNWLEMLEIRVHICEPSTQLTIVREVFETSEK